jgi:PAS domain S-box-containing protein
MDRTHFWFSLLCFGLSAYLLVRAGTYRVQTPQELVDWRRTEVAIAAWIFGVLPWFITSYTRVGRRWFLIAASLCVAFIGLGINLLLPHGLSFIELPPLRWIDLPWGERVLDIRVYKQSGWHDAAWAVILVIFGHAIYACISQYRRGAHTRALLLMLGLGNLIGFISFNQVVNRGYVDFIQTGEFGLVALVVVMSYALARELRDHDARARTILDNVPSSIYIKSTQGRYLYVNRYFEAQHGVRGETVLGKTDRQLFPSKDAGALDVHDRDVIANDGVYQYEEIANVDHELHTLASIKFPLRDLDGTVYGVCGVSADLTELRKAQLEALTLRDHIWHADRVARTSQISASLAHELNQPLSAILSNAQAGLRFLARDDADLSEIRDILSDIVRDDKRASSVIASVRALVMRQETERTRLDIAQTAHELLALIRSELVERRIQFDTALEPDCIIRGNKSQIQQVMLNLVMNAADAMTNQPETARRLTVSARRTEEGSILVGVRDNGRGISNENLARIFDSFWTTKQHGMGVGLVVCRSIVESHEGAIWIEPNRQEGVTAYFILPAEGSARPASKLAL